MVEFLGLMRVKNEGRWMRRALESISFCEKIVVLDNHSTDNTREVCTEFSNVDLTRSKFEDKYREGADREWLAAEASKYNPEWIVSLAGDEILEPGAFAKIREAALNPDVKCIETICLTLWNDEDTLRVDGFYKESYRHPLWRFIKNTPLTYESARNVLPREFTHRPFTRVNLAMWHMGYIDAPMRKMRVERYEKELGGDDDYRRTMQGDPEGPDVSENRTGEPFRLQSVEEYLVSVGNIYARLPRR